MAVNCGHAPSLSLLLHAPLVMPKHIGHNLSSLSPVGGAHCAGGVCDMATAIICRCVCFNAAWELQQ